MSDQWVPVDYNPDFGDQQNSQPPPDHPLRVTVRPWQEQLPVTPQRARGWTNSDTDQLGTEQDQLLNQYEGPAQVPPTPAETLQYLARGAGDIMAPAATGLVSGEPNPNWSLPVPEYGKVPQLSTDPRYAQALLEMAGMLEPPAKMAGVAVAAAPLVARLAPDMAAGAANAMRKMIPIEHDPFAWTGSTPVKMLPATPEDYRAAQASFKTASKNPLTTDYLAEGPTEHKLFLSADNKIGFAISPDGNINYVFKHPESPQKNAAQSVLSTAVQNGGNQLDAYDGVLPHFYGRNDFRAVARIPWDDQYAKPGWDYNKYGRPDIVFMVHDPYYKAGYLPGDGVRVNTLKEATDLQEAEAARIDGLKTSALNNFREMANTATGLKGWGQFMTPEEQGMVTSRNAQTLANIFSELPFTPEEAASVAYSGRAKRGWYTKSAKAIVDIFGPTDAPRFVALLGALSPRTSVESNAINALNTWVNWVKAGKPTDTAEIMKVLGQSVQGNKGEGSVLGAWKANVIRALTSKDPANLELSGPKVGSFHPNLRGAVNEVTNDAWMANYANISQDLFQSRATKDPTGAFFGAKSVGYVATSAAFRRAADILSHRTGEVWTPAEIQETIWSWSKTLAEKAQGTKGQSSIEQLLRSGNISHEEIANTPDFALLFLQDKYRKILELGGYGQRLQEAAAARGGPRSGTSAVTGTPLSAEGSGLAEGAFREHLYSAGRRLDERRARGRMEREG